MNQEPKSGATVHAPNEAAAEWARGLDAEEYLLIHLARPVRQFAAVADLCRSLLEGRLDGGRLVSLAIDHAVFPLVFRNLKSIGGASVVSAPVAALTPYYHSSHRNGLLLAHTLFGLVDHLAEANVEVAIHKGLVVASEYYGEIGDRVFGDLDVFVRRAAVPAAAETLENLGYVPVDPLPTPVEDYWRHYRPWQNPHGNAIGFAKDIGKGDRVDVDLQWGLAPRYFTLALRPDSLWERLRTVSVLDRQLQTFSSEDTFLLLCLHGAKHSWTELRQVVDIGAFLSATPDLDWDSVLDLATRAHCRKIVLLAALLGSELQGAPLPRSVRTEADTSAIRDLFDRIVAWRFAERRSRFGRLNQSVSFHLRARDRLRDCTGTVVHDLQTAFKSGRQSPSPMNRRSPNRHG